MRWSLARCAKLRGNRRWLLRIILMYILRLWFGEGLSGPCESRRRRLKRSSRKKSWVLELHIVRTGLTRIFQFARRLLVCVWFWLQRGLGSLLCGGKQNRASWQMPKNESHLSPKQQLHRRTQTTSSWRGFIESILCPSTKPSASRLATGPLYKTDHLESSKSLRPG